MIQLSEIEATFLNPWVLGLNQSCQPVNAYQNSFRGGLSTKKLAGKSPIFLTGDTSTQFGAIFQPAMLVVYRSVYKEVVHHLHLGTSS